MNPQTRANPVFWLMWLLPGSAVVAGLSTLAIALHGADRPLPEAYHWEGERLDADFARQRAALRLGVQVTFDARGGRCHARFSAAGEGPSALNVLLTHGSDAGFDRALRLPRIGPGEYAAPCAPLAAGKWRLSVDDPAGVWGVRAELEGAVAHVEFEARDPGSTS
jgi:hypothetical protein